jgi:hypothetical protein
MRAMEWASRRLYDRRCASGRGTAGGLGSRLTDVWKRGSQGVYRPLGGAREGDGRRG